MFDYRFSLDNLSSLTDLSKRTIRYYIQLKLVPRPLGEGRASYYLKGHLECLLKIKMLTSAGVSLDRVREVLAGGPTPVPPKTRQPGSLEVKSHLYLAPGLELTITAGDTDLDEGQIRDFTRSVLELAKGLGSTKPGPDPKALPADPAPEIPGEAKGSRDAGPRPHPTKLKWLDEVVDISLGLDAPLLRQVGEGLRDPKNVNLILESFAEGAQAPPGPAKTLAGKTPGRSWAKALAPKAPAKAAAKAAAKAPAKAAASMARAKAQAPMAQANRKPSRPADKAKKPQADD
ncbi:MAG: helix-turn-helix domain-containing protein [Deltaproteobacteria bacterium]|nr:helix-turn-helix domain-containing protein [Deltaproteobacteria bacterium]